MECNNRVMFVGNSEYKYFGETPPCHWIGTIVKIDGKKVYVVWDNSPFNNVSEVFHSSELIVIKGL